MTRLRQRMIEELRLRDYSEHTIAAYVSGVYRLANHFHKSPDKLGREEIRAFLLDLIEEKQVSWAYYKQMLASLRFFYRHVLRRGEVVEDIRGPRSQKRLPVVLSVEEVARFFKAIPSLKHRTILMLAYGAGLRIGEAVRVRLSDIGSPAEGHPRRARQGQHGSLHAPLSGAAGDFGPLLLGGSSGGSAIHHAQRRISCTTPTCTASSAAAGSPATSPAGLLPEAIISCRSNS